MSIDEPIRLKKYKGLTIRQIYQGSNSISHDIFKDYFSDLISSPIFIANLDPLEKDLVDLLNIRVTNNCFFINAKNSLTAHDKSLLLAKLFRVRKTYNGKNRVFYSINEFIRITNLYRDEPIVTVCADPNYIHWCLENDNLSNFCINPNDIKVLENLKVTQYQGIRVRYTGDLIYEFEPIYSTHQIPFDTKTIEINCKKIDRLSKKQPTYHNKTGSMDETSYTSFNGSYVQGVEGWSDQDIDDVLGGNPDAYWNLD